LHVFWGVAGKRYLQAMRLFQGSRGKHLTPLVFYCYGAKIELRCKKQVGFAKRKSEVVFWQESMRKFD
jgi:hypothetical protein